METTKIETFLTEAIQRYHPMAIALSNDLYAHPEVSNEEFRSSQKVVDILKEAGFAVEYPYMGYPTAFHGLLDNGDGPSVAIMVEYDALPGLGHACGHNAHCSMAVLAAVALASVKDRFHGKLHVFGTPAEEADGAKVGMARHGAFDGMDLAIMNHSWSGGACTPNMSLLGLQCYIIQFTGKSAHAAAAPWEGHNALTAARKFLDLLDARRESFTADIRVSGIITDGGRSPNIIPDTSTVRLEFRADSRGKVRALDDIVHKCAQGAGLAMDCQVEFTSAFEGFDDMVRVPELEQAAVQVFEQLGYPCGPVDMPNGSSDVGNVSYHCPTIQPLMSISDTFYALHTPQFRDETIKPAAHKGIADGAALIAALVYRTLTDDSFREMVAASYQAQRAKKL